MRSRAAAFWSSWADGLSMIQRRHGPVAELIVRELSVEHPVFHLAGVVAARSPHRDGICRPRLGGFGKWKAPT